MGAVDQPTGPPPRYPSDAAGPARLADPRRYVAIVGPDEGATTSQCAAARAAGQWLGDRGAVVLTGGLGGVMAAAAEGVEESEGINVGLLPGSDRAAGNPHLTVNLPTGMGEMRNALLVRSADVVLAIGGSWGTLSEIALALRTGVPVVALDSWALPEPGVTSAGSIAEALELVASILDGPG